MFPYYQGILLALSFTKAGECAATEDEAHSFISDVPPPWKSICSEWPLSVSREVASDMDASAVSTLPHPLSAQLLAEAVV